MVSLKIIVQNGNVDVALRKLKAFLGNSGTIQALKEKEYYIKPGEKRRLKKEQGIKNWRKQQRKMNNYR